MKIVGILRGFPGLGRVVSGTEVITHFRDHFDAEILIFSYLQGEEYLKTKGIAPQYTVKSQDYSSIGIIPVSDFGEFIIQTVGNFKPDLILIDGEPLMVQCLKLVYPKIRMAVLLNPFDVDNPHNQKSSSIFFNDLYSRSDLAIVHGFSELKSLNGYKNLHSINTIIREEVISISSAFSKNKICCVLGGGTANGLKEFEDSTMALASLFTVLPEYLPQFEYHIFCSGSLLLNRIAEKNRKGNISIHHNIESSDQYFKDSKLIITRAGRNMLSELLFLGIPTIAIPVGCKYRTKEQIANAKIVEIISQKKIIYFDLDSSVYDFVSLCKSMIKLNSRGITTWEPGNKKAIELIANLIIS